MKDKELLDKAAKAAGIYKWQTRDSGVGFYWYPLKDDGDALRLAVKLGFGFEIWKSRCWIWALAERNEALASEAVMDNPYAATRRAIVIAAAAIGEQK